MSDTIHAFERSGLGKAPFRFIGCEEKRGPIDLGNGLTVGAPGQPMGTCAHCGTGIAVCCTIQSADGKRFVVGNVCVNKTGDKGLSSQVKKAINKRIRAKKHEQALARFEWIKANIERAKPAMSRLPHPNGFAGKNAYDWAFWMLANAGDQGRIDVERMMKKVLQEAA